MTATVATPTFGQDLAAAREGNPSAVKALLNRFTGEVNRVAREWATRRHLDYLADELQDEARMVLTEAMMTVQPEDISPELFWTQIKCDVLDRLQRFTNQQSRKEWDTIWRFQPGELRLDEIPEWAGDEEDGEAPGDYHETHGSDQLSATHYGPALERHKREMMPAGRICTIEGCTTKLSQYNLANQCHQCRGASEEIEQDTTPRPIEEVALDYWPEHPPWWKVRDRLDLVVQEWGRHTLLPWDHFPTPEAVTDAILVLSPLGLGRVQATQAEISKVTGIPRPTLAARRARLVDRLAGYIQSLDEPAEPVGGLEDVLERAAAA